MKQEEMFEFLPPDIQRQYQNLHSPEIVDEEKPILSKNPKVKRESSSSCVVITKHIRTTRKWIEKLTTH